MALIKLRPYFEEDNLDVSFNKGQLDELYEVFKNDFVYNPLVVNGKRIKIIHHRSRSEQY